MCLLSYAGLIRRPIFCMYVCRYVCMYVCMYKYVCDVYAC